MARMTGVIRVRLHCSDGTLIDVGPINAAIGSLQWETPHGTQWFSDVNEIDAEGYATFREDSGRLGTSMRGSGAILQQGEGYGVLSLLQDVPRVWYTFTLSEGANARPELRFRIWALPGYAALLVRENAPFTFTTADRRWVKLRMIDAATGECLLVDPGTLF